MEFSLVCVKYILPNFYNTFPDTLDHLMAYSLRERVGSVRGAPLIVATKWWAMKDSDLHSTV